MEAGPALNYPLLYLEHLGERDYQVLAEAEGQDPKAWRARLRTQPELIKDVLGSPRLFDVLFGQNETELAHRMTPFLTFAVLVHRALKDLERVSYVDEWAGPRQRLPLFDVDSLREFIGEGARRFFLIELLASFVRIASGTGWVKTRRGYKRRRFSELDPVRLAEMVEMMPTEHRPAGYRRLGDVSMYLSGVFPVHTTRHPLPPVQRERLARSAGLERIDVVISEDGLHVYEAVGAAWYRRAVESAAAVSGAGPEFLLDIADHFRTGRRVLNFMADRYLFPQQFGLVGPPSS